MTVMVHCLVRGSMSCGGQFTGPVPDALGVEVGEAAADPINPKLAIKTSTPAASTAPTDTAIRGLVSMSCYRRCT